jgi:hypothetical protein
VEFRQLSKDRSEVRGLDSRAVHPDCSLASESDVTASDGQPSVLCFG